MDKNKTTDWFDLVAWGKTAEIISQYCGKGKLIGVIGQLQTRSYTNNEGKNIKVHEIMVNSIEMLGGDQAQSQSTAPAPQIPEQAPKAPTKKITEEDEKDASGLIEEDLSDVPLPFEL
jgi:single-strand DNA-binding protein